MSIVPLAQFEADLEAQEADRRAYERLQPPKTIVVRYGSMGYVGEYPYTGDAKPGCGSKLVVRTHRGTEVGEMLTTTCTNSGCSKSVTRREMLDYIDRSGGRDYPFRTDGRVLRVATMEDLDGQAKLTQRTHARTREARRIAEAMGLELKIIEAEAILGGERLTVYFTTDDQPTGPGGGGGGPGGRGTPAMMPDVQPLRERLQRELGVRVDLKQIGARDEARLTADYERCGQYCCCKSFLKVLRPVSMRSAREQKQTLDPLKISGRCGRLMCCLRYEEEAYEDLRRRLPGIGDVVGTPEGDGAVIDAQLLTQLVLVRLADGREVALAVEELVPVGSVLPVARPGSGVPGGPEGPAGRGGPGRGHPPREGPGPGRGPGARVDRGADGRGFVPRPGGDRPGGDRPGGDRPGGDRPGADAAGRTDARTDGGMPGGPAVGMDGGPEAGPGGKRRRRRRGVRADAGSQTGADGRPGSGAEGASTLPRRVMPGIGVGDNDGAGRESADGQGSDADGGEPGIRDEGAGEPRRKRRRRRRGGGAAGGPLGGGGGTGPGTEGSGGDTGPSGGSGE